MIISTSDATTPNSKEIVFNVDSNCLPLAVKTIVVFKVPTVDKLKAIAMIEIK